MTRIAATRAARTSNRFIPASFLSLGDHYPGPVLAVVLKRQREDVTAGRGGARAVVYELLDRERAAKDAAARRQRGLWSARRAKVAARIRRLVFDLLHGRE